MTDLRFALRQLAKSPGFTIVAILSLALGIGANTAVFSLLNAVLLQQLPVREPEQLVLFNWVAQPGAGPHSSSGWQTRDPRTGGNTSTSFSIPTFRSIRDHNETLQGTFAFAPFGGVNVGSDGETEIVDNTQLVSGDYHAILGVTAAAGRLLTPSDDLPGADPAAVISYRYWQRRFGGNPAAVGKVIQVNNSPFTIVGVTAPAFRGTLQVGESVDLTIPLSLQARLHVEDGDRSDFWWVRIMGRMKAGVSAEQVRANLNGIFQESARDAIDLPEAAADHRAVKSPAAFPMSLRVESGAQGLTEAKRSYQKSLALLASLVGLVLLIACANVANLLLARGAARRREIALRLALGASRVRIVRQLLAESILLAVLGGIVGGLFALWGRDALVALQPLGRSQPAINAALDLRVLGFTSALAVLTGLVFGLAPALRATRIDLTAEFQGSARALGTGSRSGLAKSLMVIQVALSLVLLVGAGLFIRTLQNLEHVDVGFDHKNLLLFQIDAPASGADAKKSADIYTQVSERIAAIPGVRQVGFSRVPLLSNNQWSGAIGVQNPGSAPRREGARINGIDPNFLPTIRLPVLFGRNFTAHDDETGAKVVIINQTLARLCFGEENAVGRHLGFGTPQPNVEVIGVARDAQYYNVHAAPPPTLYAPYRQLTNASAVTYTVRLDADPAAVMPAIRAAVRGVDPRLPLADIRTQDDQIDRLFTQERLFASLCTCFGLLALGLAGVGLYGLMSYTVLRRTGEIGLRMALGALPKGVQWMIVRESLILVSLGVAIGAAASFAATRSISSMLFGLKATDPVTYVTAALVLVAIALIAALLPARRAARVDPMVALRTE